MTKLKNTIDFELIWKKVHNTISKEESLKLEQWASEKKLHKHYLKNAENYYKDGSGFNNNPEVIDHAWDKISSKIEKKRRFKVKYIAFISAAASIILFIAVIFNRNNSSIIKTNNNHDIVSSHEKALLILNNGKTFELENGKELFHEENGISIASSGKELAYEITKNSQQSNKFNTIKIPRGGYYKIKLSDGTKIWLNSESSLTYPVKFKENERVVALSGEAFFEVTKNKDAPFKVTSVGQTVEVLGTSFNISSYKEDSAIYTTLVEGMVSVVSSKNPERKMILHPNEQSITSRTEGSIVKKDVDITPYTAWKNGRLIFEEQELEEITKTLSKWYDVNFQFEKESLRKIKFTGDLKREDSFKNILSKLEKTDEVKFSITGRNVIIK